MSGPDDQSAPPEGITIDRRTGADGHEVALVQRGAEFEIIYNGTFLMASDCRRSERTLAELALAPLSQRDDLTILVAGLGMGHTLRAVLDSPGVVRVDVVEISDAVVEWNRAHFAALNGDALKDPRVHLHTTDLASYLKQARYAAEGPEKEGWFGILLDVDNGPSWTTRPENAALYDEDGLARLEAALRPGGVLAVWSAQREVEFVRRMHARLTQVAEMAVPVDVRGKSSLDYVYRGRRKPDPRPTGSNGSAAKKPSA